MVSKNVKNRGMIECIFFGPELNIDSILEVVLKDENVVMESIDKMVLSSNNTIMIANSEDKYFINNIELFVERLDRNKKKNDFLRQS